MDTLLGHSPISQRIYSEGQETFSERSLDANLRDLEDSFPKHAIFPEEVIAFFDSFTAGNPLFDTIFQDLNIKRIRFGSQTAISRWGTRVLTLQRPSDISKQSLSRYYQDLISVVFAAVLKQNRFTLNPFAYDDRVSSVALRLETSTYSVFFSVGSGQSASVPGSAEPDVRGHVTSRPTPHDSLGYVPAALCAGATWSASRCMEDR